MSAKIIDFAERRPPASGNGAREMLIDVGLAVGMDDPDRESAVVWADWLLTEFWARGFKVVPVND